MVAFSLLPKANKSHKPAKNVFGFSFIISNKKSKEKNKAKISARPIILATASECMGKTKKIRALKKPEVLFVLAFL